MNTRHSFPPRGQAAPALPAVRQPSDLGDWFTRLKAQIDLHDLASRLGLERPFAHGNYRSPHHPDRSPSLSIFDDGRAWLDHSTNKGGSCIDLVQYCREELASPLEAADLLGDWYAIPRPRSNGSGSSGTSFSVPKTTEDYIADRCLQLPEPVLDYLGERGIDAAIASKAIRNKTLGWSTWHSSKLAEGTPGHGGPAAAFIVRSPETGHVVAVDTRYIDPALNGNVKTQCRGEREGYGWTSDPKLLKRAHTVYIVESPVNALSVESANLSSGTAAFAVRGTGNGARIDWSFLKGKRVLIALDHTDAINPKTNQRPGLAAAWQLSEALTALGISNQLVDMQGWEEGEDINDVLKQYGAEELLKRLKQTETWLIPGMPGDGKRLGGTRRIFLPVHDFAVYWRYRVKEDFTQYVDEARTDDDGNKSETLVDLCSFRLASLSRLRIQSHLATLNGTPDSQPETVFGVSAQLARHGTELQRAVMTDDKLFNLDWWRASFGAIWRPAQFQRMLNLMERAAHIGARDVVNFVGMAWRDGQLAALEGSDCYFLEPAKQCLYYNMRFPRGSASDARQVIQAYQATFRNNAASIALVWILGAHLKTVLGFYPHFQMQAEKGSGKSKLLESLQASAAFQVLSGQMLKTDHRRRASVSYTSHPVGWDEFSKLPKTVLSDIDGLLQSTYRFEFTRVGANLTPYLMCAPVLLAGEEVDVQSLQSKICRSTLAVKKQGTMIPHELPQFPVWSWLQHLAQTDPQQIRQLHQKQHTYCMLHSRAASHDATANRMMENYAAILTAWHLLCDFARINPGEGGFAIDLVAEMNTHIADTDGTRLPWVWIMEIMLSELEANRYDHPYCWEEMINDQGAKEWVLFIRPNHVMDHISTAPHLRMKFDALPIKTGRVFKQQLLQSGEVFSKNSKTLDDVERAVRGQRAAHMTGLSLTALERLGLYATPVRINY